jgi:predicted dinucleotide-binding enzyme
MRIGIIGAGNVGGTLGRAWAQKSHEIMFGVRQPKAAKVGALLEQVGPSAKAGSVAEAAAFGSVVMLATPWPAARDALRAAGNLADKVLLDCTNPLKADFSGLEIGHTTSGAEQVALWAKGARVVKIFNSTGFENMANPKYGKGTAVTMFFAGDDAPAKGVAAQLAREIGFEPVDAGPLASARLLEPLAMLWVTLAYGQKQGTGIAFKLLRR